MTVSTTAPMQPWDGKTMTKDLLQLVQQLHRERLDRLDAPAVPGTYLQFFATRRVEPVLGSLIATGRLCSYAGVASRSLRERLGRYRQSIRGIEVLEERDILIAMLPCDSTASARYSEAALIEALDPVLNGMGWGSKVPGAKRTDQRISPSDALLPRRWSPPASPADRACAQLQVVGHLARMDPAGPRWPAAITDERPRPRRTRSRPEGRE